MTSPRPWYKIRNADNGVAEVYIYEQIGEDWWTGDGVTAKQFAQDLRAITAANIHLHINSPGGLVFDGQAIHTTLRNHPATVTTYIDGLAASIASVIALAGDHVIMAENALFMIHDPSGGCLGTADDMRKMAAALDAIKDSIVTVYERTGQDRALLEQAMADETWYTAAEALQAGFVDEVAGPQQVAAALTLDGLPFRNVGRVLSQRNFDKLTEAHERIGEVLADAEPEDAAAAKVSGSGGAPDRSTSGGAPAPINPADAAMQAARLR